MQNNKKSNITDDSHTNKKCYDRRKRINTIKTAIIIIVIVLMILPTIICIILGMQVRRLQHQMNELLSIHEEYGISYDSENHYAYAAENINSNESADNPETGENQSPAEKTNTFSETNSEMPEEADGSPQPKASDSDELMPEDNKNVAGEENEKDTEKETSAKSPKESKVTFAEKEISLSSGIYAGKKVYLTFDDGPSIYTDDILDILQEYQVKATFFVVGKTDQESKKMYQRIVNEGHTLGMHSYSHKYSKIYNSVEDFDKDFTKLWELLYDTTGYKPSIYRFPGGSDNHVNKHGMEEFIRYLNKASIVYFDWNVLNGDATGKRYTQEQLTKNVLDGIVGKDNAIVLMHDAQTKKTTVDSLPGLLDELLSEGAELLALNKDVPPIQMIDAYSVK